MALLSKLTGSLPNPLTLLQGDWKIKYKNSYSVESKDTSKLSDSVSGQIKDIATNMLDNQLKDPWYELKFDSIISVNEIEEADIVKQQIEKGSFRSVNKIRKPKMFKVTAAVGGVGYGIEETLTELKELLPLARKEVGQSLGFKDTMSAINGIADILAGNMPSSDAISSYNKVLTKNYIPMEFRIETPFDTIDGLNLVKFDYTFRRETGRNMLIVDMTFEEILEGGSVVSFTKANVKLAGDSDIINGGIRAIQGA